jgi:chromosome segregation ATPase
VDLTAVFTVLGTVIPIIVTLLSITYWLGGKFKEIEMRFNIIDERFRQIDKRFEQIDERFNQIDERFKQVDERFRQIDERFKQIDERFRQIDERFRQIDERFRQIEDRFKQIDERFRQIGEMLKQLDSKIDSRISRIAEAFTSYQEFFVEYLMVEGVIKPERVSVVKGEARRIMRLAISANPLSKEEWRRLGELLDKDLDELTYEEALELRELARKVVREYMEYREAWQLLRYASIAVALKRKEKESGQQSAGPG